MFEIYEKPIEEGMAKFENIDNFNTSDDEFEILWHVFSQFCDTFLIKEKSAIIMSKQIYEAK